MRLGCSYFGNRIHRHVHADMRHLQANGFNYVVHTFCENDFRFYRQTMKELVAISHDEGLEVQIDPWGVGKIFGGEAFTEFITVHPECMEIASDGKTAPLACLNHPIFRQFISEWVEAALETGADVVFWDEPHFYLSHWLGGRPDTWGCLCGICKDKFQEMFNHPMPQEETDEVKTFKEICIKEFLHYYMKQVKGGNRKNSLCLIPTPKVREDISHWREFVEMPELDMFGTDPYWTWLTEPVGEYVGYFSRCVKTLCDSYKKQHHIWIQGFKIEEGKEEEVRTAIRAAVEAGVTDLAVWGFDACHHISSIRCGNSPKVWGIICEEFRSLAKK